MNQEEIDKELNEFEVASNKKKLKLEHVPLIADKLKVPDTDIQIDVTVGIKAETTVSVSYINKKAKNELW